MKYKYPRVCTLLFLFLVGVPGKSAIRPGPSVHLEALDVSSDGRTLAVSLWSFRRAGFKDMTDLRYWIRLYALDTWNYCDIELDDTSWAVELSPDGRLVATGHRDGTLMLWDIRSRRAVQTLAAHEDTIWSLDFSTDGKHFASGAMDGAAKVWASPSGELLANLKHDDWVTSVSISPDGKNVATGSRDGHIRIWDLPSGTQSATWAAHIGAVRPGAPNPPKGIMDLTFSHDGKLIASGGRDNTLAVWDFGTRELKSRLAEDPRAWINDVTAVAFSPDDRMVAAGYGEAGGEHLRAKVPSGAVVLYETTNGKRSQLLGGQDVRTEGLVFIRDGREIIAAGGASASTKAVITVWDVASGSRQKQFQPRSFGSRGCVDEGP